MSNCRANIQALHIFSNASARNSYLLFWSTAILFIRASYGTCTWLDAQGKLSANVGGCEGDQGWVSLTPSVLLAGLIVVAVIITKNRGFCKCAQKPSFHQAV